MTPLVIAHRGYKQVTPENTLAAFESAVHSGAQMIETDIHVCKSGEIVIMHDDNVGATSNGHGKISEMTLTELKQLDVGGWFGDAYAGQQIVTLPELVEFYQKHPELKLLLEFKDEWTQENCRRAIEQLNAGNLRERTVLESFDTKTMASLRDVAPDYDRGLLIEYPDPNYPVTNSPLNLAAAPTNSNNLFATGNRPDSTGGILANPIDAKALTPQLLTLCKELDVMYLNPSVRIMWDHPELVKQCHDAGLQVMVWTADKPADFAHLTDLGVDAICTNKPAYLLGWLEGIDPTVDA